MARIDCLVLPGLGAESVASVWKAVKAIQLSPNLTAWSTDMDHRKNPWQSLTLKDF